MSESRVGEKLLGNHKFTQFSSTAKTSLLSSLLSVHFWSLAPKCHLRVKGTPALCRALGQIIQEGDSLLEVSTASLKVKVGVSCDGADSARYMLLPASAVGKRLCVCMRARVGVCVCVCVCE